MKTVINQGIWKTQVYESWGQNNQKNIYKLTVSLENQQNLFLSSFFFSLQDAKVYIYSYERLWGKKVEKQIAK